MKSEYSQKESNLMTFWLLVQMLYHWATEDSWELRPVNKGHVTNILHSARTRMSICAHAQWWRSNSEFLGLVNTWEKIIFQSATQALRRKNPSIPNKRRTYNLLITPFAVHYEKIRNDLREKANNSAKIHSLAPKYNHLRINQIQLRFLHFHQHSITLLDIHMRHWPYKREKYTFINANIKVMNTIFKVNRDNWQKSANAIH